MRDTGGQSGHYNKPPQPQSVASQNLLGTSLDTSALLRNSLGRKGTNESTNNLAVNRLSAGRASEVSKSKFGKYQKSGNLRPLREAQMEGSKSNQNMSRGISKSSLDHIVTSAIENKYNKNVDALEEGDGEGGRTSIHKRVSPNQGPQNMVDHLQGKGDFLSLDEELGFASLKSVSKVTSKRHIETPSPLIRRGINYPGVGGSKKGGGADDLVLPPSTERGLNKSQDEPEMLEDASRGDSDVNYIQKAVLASGMGQAEGRPARGVRGEEDERIVGEITGGMALAKRDSEGNFKMEDIGMESGIGHMLESINSAHTTGIKKRPNDFGKSQIGTASKFNKNKNKVILKTKKKEKKPPKIKKPDKSRKRSINGPKNQPDGGPETAQNRLAQNMKKQPPDMILSRYSIISSSDESSLTNKLQSRRNSRAGRGNQPRTSQGEDQRFQGSGKARIKELRNNDPGGSSQYKINVMSPHSGAGGGVVINPIKEVQNEG